MTSAEYADALRHDSAADTALPARVPVEFTAVFHEFAGYVPGLLRRLGVAEREVEDVAQDVFTVVHKQLPGFRGDSTVKTWICGVTLRVARSHLRLARVRRLFLGEPPVPAAHAATQFESAELRERVQMLQQALDGLSDPQRRVFVLYEIEELSMHEIAGLLACPEKTAYTRLHAARKNIEKTLRRRLAIGGAP